MPSTPRVIPVLDIMAGQVVRAVGGRREQYRPIRSTLTESTEPGLVAAALLAATGAAELYVADLDAITGRHRLSPAVRTLLEGTTVPVWLDAGFGQQFDILDLPPLPHLRPVVGFETCRTPEFLRDFTFSSNAGTVAFSIDLRHGELSGNWRGWALRHAGDGLGLTRRAVELGVRTLIVLDLARLGTGTGTGTESLLNAIRTEFPKVELIAGGGVKGWADVDALGEAGANAVLVASALHDGTLTFPRGASTN